jgi:hypothetical protein
MLATSMKRVSSRGTTRASYTVAANQQSTSVKATHGERLIPIETIGQYRV